MSTKQPTAVNIFGLIPYPHTPNKSKIIKKHLMNYLLFELHRMENERKRRVNSSEFADFVLVRRELIEDLLDPDNLNLPDIDCAKRLALTLQSNDINRICEYSEIDDNLLKIMYYYKQLTLYQKESILEVLEKKKTQDPMPAWYKFGKK